MLAAMERVGECHAQGRTIMAVLMTPYECAGRSCDGVFLAEEGSPLGRILMKLIALLCLLPAVAFAWPDPNHPFKPSHVLSSYDQDAPSDQIWKWFFTHLAEYGFKMPKSGESFYFDSYLKEVTVRDLESGDLIFFKGRNGEDIEGILIKDAKEGEAIVVICPLPDFMVLYVPLKGEDVIGVLRCKYKLPTDGQTVSSSEISRTSLPSLRARAR